MGRGTEGEILFTQAGVLNTEGDGTEGGVFISGFIQMYKPTQGVGVEGVFRGIVISGG